jgi:oligopeptidase B
MNNKLYPEPPKATARPVNFVEFGNSRIDPWFWLRDKNNPEVIEYLKAENAYCDTVMADTRELQEKIFNEIKNRIKEDDESVHVPYNGYSYFSRTQKGKQYPVYYRQKMSGGDEEVLFDVNLMAENQPAFLFEDYAISPDNRYAAYTYNTTGSYAEFNLKVRDLLSGKDLPYTIEKVQSFVWAADSKTLFYVIGNESLRPYKVLRHNIEMPARDIPVYEEKDEIFNVSVDKTSSENYLVIHSSSFTTTEIRLLKANRPEGAFQIFTPRRKGNRYSVEHNREKGFYIYYQDEIMKNGRILLCDENIPSDPATWREIIPHDADTKIEDMDVFEKHLVLYTRSKGLTGIKIYSPEGQLRHEIKFPEPVYVVSPHQNPEYDQNVVRYSYASLNRPTTVYEINLHDFSTRILKQQEIPSGFNPEDYVVEREFATSTDGTRVPMAILYKKGLKKNGDNPALLYGYGAYGYSTDAWFRPSIFSLVDRGFVYAIGQVRGGSEMGEQWYEDGKLMKKKNSFADFISCAEHLIHLGYTSPRRLSIMGGSAGGLLVGATVNMRPDLFGAVVAAVPFVDVINTMLDETLPLTTQEYEQWGNPHEEETYRYILSYSPYDNIKDTVYPHILATAGLNDSQVLFHEPAKWVAKLRATTHGDNIILLKTNMESGHGGATGRYDALKETAFEFAFLIKALTL